MRNIDAQTKIHEFAAWPDKPAERDPSRYMNCELLDAKFKEYGRFGLPGASSSDGRGGEPPLPLLGNTDRSIVRDRNLANEYLSDAAVALERYMRIQRAWVVPRIDDTAKEKALADEKPGKPCSNVWCLHWCTGRKDDVLRNGRCPNCAMYYRRTGNERPRELCDVTNQETAACSGTATARMAE